MCITKLDRHTLWETNNRSIVLIGLSPDSGRFFGTVLKSKDPTYPVGHRVEYFSEMGHVLCAGNDADHQGECKKHPLDATYAIADTADRALSVIEQMMSWWVDESKDAKAPEAAVEEMVEPMPTEELLPF